MFYNKKNIYNRIIYYNKAFIRFEKIQIVSSLSSLLPPYQKYQKNFFILFYEILIKTVHITF